MPFPYSARFLRRSILRVGAAWLLSAVLFSLIGFVYPNTALAQHPPLQKLKVGFLRTYSMLPLYRAEQQGYFKQRGLDVDLVTLNNGAAVAAAVQSGSLDIGYAALVPIIMARSRGLNFRFFAAAGFESPHAPIIVFTASERSGVRSFKDISGKTIANNAVSSGCELGYMDHAAAAGVPLGSAKTILVPLPQMQAALELGSTDIACTTEPFSTAILASKKIGARVIATGYLAQTGEQAVLSSGYFANDDWLNTHAAQAGAFAAALEQGAQDLEANPALVQDIMVSMLRFPSEIAAAVKFVPVTNIHVAEDALQPLIDAMKRHGLIATDVASRDMQFSLPEKR